MSSSGVNGEVTGKDYDRLAFAFDRVATSLDELSVEFMRYRAYTRWAAVAAAFALAVVIIVTAWSFTITHSNSAVIDRINDCTSAGGQCYEDGAKQTDKRIAPIVTLICNATPPERRQPPC